MAQANEWQIDGGPMILLLSLEELRWIKSESPGTLLMDINGEEVEARHADEDLRFGYTAYGRKP